MAINFPISCILPVSYIIWSSNVVANKDAQVTKAGNPSKDKKIKTRELKKQAIQEKQIEIKQKKAKTNQCKIIRWK